jgi:hypothetical protein
MTAFTMTVHRPVETVTPLLQSCRGVAWVQLERDPFILVSEEGEVVSLNRKKPRLLKPTMSGEYHAVGIGAKKATTHIHRIVCETFIGPRPFEGAVVRHLDGDRFNNSATNLAWGTHAENMADMRAHGTSATGERNGQAKLTRPAVAQMREQRASGLTFKAIAKRHGVSNMTAHRAITGGSWK